jgi:hypothetical protein
LKFENLSIGVASLAILASPLITMCDGGGNAPDIGASFYDRRNMPQSITVGFSGSPGYIQVVALCGQKQIGLVTSQVEGVIKTFKGGETTYLGARCVSSSPYIIDGYGISWR